VPYTHFWHTYVHQHQHHDPSGPGADPVALVGAAVCLMLLIFWIAYRCQPR
jgi:hypothetical protein